MRRQTGPLRAVAAIAAVLTAGCGSSGVIERPATAPAPARALPPPPPAAPVDQADAVGDAIARSQTLFERGQQEVRLGHLAQAKSFFDQAIDCLLELPEGARSTARLRDHFNRLVDRISAYEIRALAEGDGFSERPSVPASIDELLDLATFDFPAPPVVAAGVGRDRPEIHGARCADSRSPEGAGVRGPVSGPPPRVVPDRARSGRAVPSDDQGAASRGRPAARPRLRAHRGKRVQVPGTVAREGQGVLAADAPDGRRAGPEVRLVYRRTVEPGEIDGGGGEIPQVPQRHVRRRLAPRARLVQRRAGDRPARRQEKGHGRLLAARRGPPVPAARDPRVRADGAGLDGHRAQPRALRLRADTRRTAGDRHGHAARAGRSPAGGRVGGRAD